MSPGSVENLNMLNGNIKDQPAGLYERLRDAIISGHFLPGMQLKEHVVCQMFGVGRAPVREAFVRLAADGLVVQVRNLGAYVRKLSVEEGDRLLEVRRVIEAGAAALAAQKAGAKERGELLKLASEVDKFNEPVLTEEHLTMELQFHREVIRLSGNEEVARVFNGIQTIFLTFFLEPKADTRMSAVTHSDIAKAIAAKDRVEAFDTMWRHLTDVPNIVPQAHKVLTGQRGVYAGRR